MKKGKMNIVMGGQAGSESKGKLGAYLAEKFKIHFFAASLSPNAGHTVVKDGVKYVTYHLPVSLVGAPNSRPYVFLGPASVINPEVLHKEISSLPPMALFIDERATIITPNHITAEGVMTKIGSTAQGVGEARASRIMRRARLAAEEPSLKPYIWPNTAQLVRLVLDQGKPVIYEMSQGFDLCLYHGVDPIYCTSRNCTPMQAFADMGIPHSYIGDIYAVIRPYPIRVNNRDGSSGPYPSKEISWEEVRKRCGAPYDITEMTTTTKLERRVFEFSVDRIKEMVKICKPDYLCLQFCNYIDWKAYGVTNIDDIPPKVWDFVNELEDRTEVPVAYLGTSGDHKGMIDRGIDR